MRGERQDATLALVDLGLERVVGAALALRCCSMLWCTRLFTEQLRSAPSLRLAGRARQQCRAHCSGAERVGCKLTRAAHHAPCNIAKFTVRVVMLRSVSRGNAAAIVARMLTKRSAVSAAFVGSLELTSLQ